MAQVLNKEYTCYNCKRSILISRVEDPSSRKKWEQWELDSVTKHECNAAAVKRQPQQHPQPQTAKLSDGPILGVMAENLAELTDKVDKLTRSVEELKQELKSKK